MRNVVLISRRFLGVLLLVACTATQHSRPLRPAIGPGSDWLTTTPDGDVGLCALRDSAGRICGWAESREVTSWLREAESLLAATETGRRQTSQLELSDGVTVHLLRGSPGAVAAFQLVFADRQRHISSGDPLTRERAEAILARMRSALSTGRAPEKTGHG